MERKLASIRKIEEIRPIIGADKICQYRVGGWWVVDGVNKYNVGDNVIYFEIDSFLPELPQYDFLRKSSFRKHGDGSFGYRLKTCKFKGAVSQGLLFPIPEPLLSKNSGDDVTSDLSVKKYEAAESFSLAGDQAGPFPLFISKTDEIRVQNLSDFPIDPRGKRAYITEKLNGSSHTSFFKDGKFGVCSRNFELKTDDSNATNAFVSAARSLNLEEKLKNYSRNLALQGELIGSGMNGNDYKMQSRTIKFFTIQDLDKGERLKFEEFEKVLNDLRLESVPVINRDFILPTENFIETLLNMADGKSVLNASVDREGIVVRGIDEDFSFKAISNKHLLSEK